MSLLEKRLVGIAAVAALSAVLAGKWYQKSSEFRPPEVNISVSVDYLRLDTSCSIDGRILCAAGPTDMQQPFSVNMTSDELPGFPWRYLRPWSSYRVMQNSYIEGAKDVNNVQARTLGFSVERTKKSGEYKFGDFEKKTYNTLEITDTNRGRLIYIFADKDSIRVPVAEPLIVNKGQDIIINYWDSNEPGNYTDGSMNVLSLDLETLEMKKINSGGYAMCAASENLAYVLARSSKFGHEGYYIDPETGFSEKLWDDNLTRTRCKISSDENSVSFFTGMGAGVGYRLDGYNPATRRHSTGLNIYHDADINSPTRPLR